MKSTDSLPSVSFRGPLLISGVLLACMTVLSVWAWIQIGPNTQIPVHWGIDGKADGFGSRNMLFLLPGITIGLIGLFWVLPRIEPRKGHLLRSSQAYKAVWLGMLFFEAALHTVMVLIALGREIAMDRFIAVALGFLFALIGNFLGKVRSNYVFGVRTPWTLSSERSWNKTHRLTGWLFVLYGVAMIGAGLALDGAVFFWGTITFIPGIVVFACVYSYWEWRRDPEREFLGKA